MSEDKQKEEVKSEAVETAAPETKPKSNLMKYIIFGVSGFALIAVIAFGIGFLLKEEPKTEIQASSEIVSAKDSDHTEEQKADSHETSIEKPPVVQETKHQETAAESSDLDEYAINEEDQGAIDKIVNNLAFLDYQPTESEMQDEESKQMQDSLEKADWFEVENKKLDTRKKELDKKERELTALQKEVDAKIIRIEQAESNRVSQLAKLYDGMDSRAVAKLMMNLDNATVVSILPRMNNKSASQVLQLIPSQRAAVLSKQMITIADE